MMLVGWASLETNLKGAIIYPTRHASNPYPNFIFYIALCLFSHMLYDLLTVFIAFPLLDSSKLH